MKIVFRKGTSIRLYPAVFCSLPASTVPDNFKFDTKSENSTFSATINSFPAVLLKTGIYIRFRTAVQATAPCQSIKVLSSFLSVGFEIIVDSADWMKAENGGIQTTGCAFRGAAAGNFSSVPRNK